MRASPPDDDEEEVPRRKLMRFSMVVVSASWVVRAFVGPGRRCARHHLTTTRTIRPLSSLAPEKETEEEERSPTPVTLLSGFLGAGKTTLLQQLLKRAKEEDLKIGVVVNDVAAVNVDSKLVKSPFEELNAGGTLKEVKGEDAAMAEFVELGDGCICCSIADELFTTLSQLVAVARYRGFSYDHIVVEATGVAEPRAVRDSFQDAAFEQLPLMEEIALDTMVTVVDSAGFLAEYSETAPISRRPDLAASEDDAVSFVMAQFGGALRRSVVDLLLEQVECADVVLLNKADLVRPEDLDRLDAVVTSINTQATVQSCVKGDAPLAAVLGAAKALGAAAHGPVDEHRIAVDAVKEATTTTTRGRQEEEAHSSAAHSHSAHSHSHAEEETNVEESSCSSCGSHAHGHAHAAEEETKKETSTHSHDEHDAHDDASSSHSSSHSSHSHSHAHEDGFSATTARTRFGIDSFVYSRRRPFSPERLEKVVSLMPANVTEAFESHPAAVEGNAELQKALGSLVRSKGFMWLANSHEAAYYWSHAGRFFQAPILGRWWATLDQQYWPPDQIDSIQADFQGDDGDRRQEIVFIGVDAVANKQPIESALDACLLTDDELDTYRHADDKLRRDTFPSNFEKIQQQQQQKQAAPAF